MVRDIYVTVTCTPFSAFGRGRHRVCVEADDTVRVYDAIAGHYTLCHSLTPRSMSAIRRIARKSANN